MEIVYLSNQRFPSERAHAVQIVEMCNAFAQHGATVTLLVTDQVTPIVQDPEEYYQVTLTFEYHKLKIISFINRGRGLFMVQRLIFSLQALRNLNAHFSKNIFLYCRDEWIAYFVSFFYPVERIIWESHEARFSFAARRLFKAGIRCVVISEGIRDEYLSKGVSSSQLLVAHDGINQSFFGPLQSKAQARARLELGQEEKVVMYIGGFEAAKGIKTFCEASRICEGVRFVAIGGNEDQIAQYQARFPTVTFLGPRPYSELKDNQQAADVLVIPNSAHDIVAEKFTSPLKLFSYMSSGIPIVASMVTSLQNVVSDREASYFTPDDPNSLAKAVEGVFSSYNECLKKAEALKERAKEYTWNSRAKHILNFVTGDTA